MQSNKYEDYPKTVVLRHKRENLKKCSLRGLEQRSDFQFLTYPIEPLPVLSDYILLTLNAPVLSKEDACRGVFILDGTWRYAEKMLRFATASQPFILRTLPNSLKTAYPRRQDDCPDPSKGLASIEAIYAAYFFLGRSTEGLLNNYHWGDQFLKENHFLL